MTTADAASADRPAASLEEALAGLPADSRIHLALPCAAVLFERMHFPATDPVELDGMVRLQLEKTLPFPVEEVTATFEPVGQSENESIVLAVAASNAQLNALSQPFRDRQLLPEKITVFVNHVAANCPQDLLVFVIYKEDEKFVLAISESGRLGFAQTHALPDANALLAELPQLLLSAEMDGIPTTFARVQLDNECAEMQPAISELFGVPVDLISLDSNFPETGNNLIPSAWIDDRNRIKTAAQTKSRLILAGAVYLVAMLCAGGYLFWLHGKVAKLTDQIRAAQPQLDFIRTRKARWTALSSAIDPAHYTVEVLFQIQKSMPSDSIRITSFEQSKDGFVIEGEAPTANLAIEFGEQLKKNPELKDFKLETGPPNILPNEHAQFRIFAKL